jgi:ATP-dependent RNA helicase DHX8/PRP22
MEELAKLEKLELVSKLSAEVTTYTGFTGENAKKLANFFINLRKKCKDRQEFQKKIENSGEALPESAYDSLDRLITTMHPKFKKTRKGTENGLAGDDPLAEFEMLAKKKEDNKTKVFKGLALHDDDELWDKAEAHPRKNGHGSQKKAEGLDDTFAELEQLAAGQKGRKNQPSRDDDWERGTKRRTPCDEYEEEERRRKKRRSRSRSRSPRRDRKGYDYDFGDKRILASRRRRYRAEDDEDEGDRVDREPTPELDDEPVPYKVYTGNVTGIKDFGVFVNLQGVKGKVDGLVHVSEIQAGARINHPSDVISKGEEVKVKVIKVDGRRVSLSMKAVDQSTGMDLRPDMRIGTGANMQSLGSKDNQNGQSRGFVSSVPVIEEGYTRRTDQKKKMTEAERWELQQLVASGAMKREELIELDNDFYNANVAEDGKMAEEDEDIDIEVREEEPPFLEGQTKQSLELSPIRVVKAPDGSLNRAAMQGATLAKDRKEDRDKQMQEKAREEAEKVDLSSQWQDPTVTAAERQFASDLRKPKGSEPVPEWKRIASHKESFGKRTSMSIKQQRESLPVFTYRKALLDAVEANQLLIVVGDTGSGKTTQLTQYLAEGGYANEGMIGCTQPRRVAAMSVAERVSQEVGCVLGHEVGYTIRFEDRTSPETRIKYMTDGILQREILLDPLLNRYSVIMLDEAHERTIATDVLFGLLKKTLKRRKDMKVIVTSATLDAEKFSTYFYGCPIFTIPGRTYPVEILYSREPETDYLDAALQTVLQIHINEPAGDILLFLTGKEEIDTSCEILTERMKALGSAAPELLVLPIYGALPSEVASRIFDPAPSGARKVVIATNIAETSITIDGIYYVVDPGFVKQTAYDPKLGVDRLQVTPISQAQAKQRAGRAGRTGPGKCYRLYTEQAFQTEMLPTTIPEIQRQNLCNTILMLKAMGINDLLHFDFMDPPPTNTMLTALEELYALSALDDDGLLTRLGRQMADFPMDPALAKSLITSEKFNCADEMLTIVAMVSASTTSIFYRPKEKEKQADQKKARFHDQHGDHLTLLNVYNGWRQSNFSTPWCHENFIQPRTMKRAEDVRNQLVDIFKRHKLMVASCGRDTHRVRQALCAGFFRNSARKSQEGGGCYTTTVEGTTVWMHPSSALFGKPAEYVIYGSLVETTKEYMHNVTSIEPKWLVEAAPTFFKIANKDGQMSKRQLTQKIQPVLRPGEDENSWRLSATRQRGRGGGGTWG